MIIPDFLVYNLFFKTLQPYENQNKYNTFSNGHSPSGIRPDT